MTIPDIALIFHKLQLLPQQKKPFSGAARWKARHVMSSLMSEDVAMERLPAFSALRMGVPEFDSETSRFGCSVKIDPVNMIKQILTSELK